VVDTAPGDVAETFDQALPVRLSTELLHVAADLAARTYTTFPVDAAPHRRASRLDNLGIRLGALGRREGALTAQSHAVEIYRRLAAANGARFEPALAKALNNLSGALSGLGRPQETLTAATEAVGIYRRLAAANPARFEPFLAGP
jgi:tetratricopeptide (TPR) repeat protein